MAENVNLVTFPHALVHAVHDEYNRPDQFEMEQNGWGSKQNNIFFQ